MGGARNAEAVRENAIVELDGGGLVPLNPEVGVACQNVSTEAKYNLVKAPSLFFKVTAATEVDRCPRVGSPRLIAYQSSLPCAGFE